jgi:signal transduction histidine kinase
VSKSRTGARWRVSLGLHGRLIVVVLLSVGAAIALLTAAFNIVLAGRLNANADDLLRTRASAELQTLSTVNGRLVISEAPDEGTGDTRVWVFAGARELEAPARVERSLEVIVRSMVSGPRAQREIAATDTRLLALPIVDRGQRLGTIVDAVSLEPYEQSERTALIASLALAAALLVAVAVAARWIVGAALRPVAQMTAAADEWSDREPGRRFGLAGSDEIARLGATLDRLLDRAAASLERERRFSAEVSHELRTPLARLLAEAQLALRGDREGGAYREALAQIVSSARQLERTLDALLAAARAEAASEPGSADAAAVARAAVDAMAALAAREHVTVTLDAPAAPLRVGASADLAERALAPVIENAIRYGRSTVTVSVARNGDGSVRFDVRDDGPGVAPDERERIFEPAVRGKAAAVPGAAAADARGAGLGLALARRLARVAGGEVEAVPSDARAGGRFSVRLPGGR